MKITILPRLIVSLFLLQVMSSVAQDKTLPDPPYLAHSANFMMILFHLDAREVQALLPEGVRVNANESGMVTAGLEMYETDRVYGVPQYAMAFIFVEVKDLASNNGTPGHWAMWGKVNEQNTHDVMRKKFNFPYDFGNVRVVEAENIYTGVAGSPGNDSIRLKIKFGDTPFSGEGIVNMCSMAGDGKIMKTEVPWFTTGSAGELLGLEIDSRGDKVLEMVKASKTFFALISTNQIFSYGRPAVN